VSAFIDTDDIIAGLDSHSFRHLAPGDYLIAHGLELGRHSAFPYTYPFRDLAEWQVLIKIQSFNLVEKVLVS
jgi:hypothetical protein